MSVPGSFSSPLKFNVTCSVKHLILFLAFASLPLVPTASVAGDKTFPGAVLSAAGADSFDMNELKETLQLDLQEKKYPNSVAWEGRTSGSYAGWRVIGSADLIDGQKLRRLVISFVREGERDPKSECVTVGQIIENLTEPEWRKVLKQHPSEEAFRRGNRHLKVQVVAAPFGNASR